MMPSNDFCRIFSITLGVDTSEGDAGCPAAALRGGGGAVGSMPDPAGFDALTGDGYPLDLESPVASWKVPMEAG